MILYNINHENTRNIAMTAKITYRTTRDILVHLEQNKMIKICQNVKKRGSCYMITAKGVEVYRKIKEVYRDMGMKIK